ncbi:hypothetical protein N7474_004214 [Penicillium riverlandense]|uniref:uncharacterized protein n=1 Tax=Penicillium riverlandense TaxID=1903569 RepID=UPI002547DF3D|nr:uncharacterized protein N7474_004214 [Penicillium riverlandense]KAJ5818623.1 hypothetical protein N7474_004214 [Penicillium riverlandense]
MASSQTSSRTPTNPPKPPSDNTSPNFADPNFDPADFLNDSLPPLTVASTQPNASRAPGSVPLTELSAQVQSVLSQISAQNVRLSSTLSQLTDEILRSGGRLAYEVEVLRGETIGLSETLTEVLREDIAKFVPESEGATAVSSRKAQLVENDELVSSPKEGEEEEEGQTTVENEEDKDEAKEKEKTVASDPEYITNLRTLNQVRSRLEDVVQIFGEAMEWPLPPSEISFSSSFISVSGPDLGAEGHSREEKGQEILRKLRSEITELLDSQGGGTAGLEAASRRVEAVRRLALVWKGSAEEKARTRVVDGLTKIVDDRRRVLEAQADQGARSQAKGRPSMEQQRRNSDSGGPGGGLFRNLQRLREEIYLE